MVDTDADDVRRFLEDVETTNEVGFEILQSVRELVYEHYPDAREEVKYGGLVFSLEAVFTGIFVHENHVTLEFSHGATFDDPDGLLEGEGKHRRHLTLESSADVRRERVEPFVEQAA